MEGDARSVIAALFQEHADSIYRFAAFSLPSHIDAKDVVQEVFLKAYKSWGTFRQEANHRSWLYRIAKNHIYDLLRKQKSENKKEQYMLAANQSTAELGSTLEYKELFYQLPVKYREVLVLRVMDGLDFDEISEIVGCSMATVRVRYHRARNKMRELLSEDVQILYGKGGTM